DSLILSRSLSLEGKSDCRINGQIVTAGTLKQLGNLIVDTYAQNENIELLKVKNHLSILDSYAGAKLADNKNEILELCNKIKEIDSLMQSLGGNWQNRERELELLDFQIKDIENANLKIGEDEDIKVEIDRLSNFEKIFESINLSVNSLKGVDEYISEAIRNLSIAEKYDEGIRDYVTRLTSAKIEIKDVLESLQNQEDNGFDQNLIDSLNKRYDEIKILKKKYGATIKDVLEYLDKIKEQYDNLLFGEEKLQKLNKQKQQIREKLYGLCAELSIKRKASAKEIEEKVLNELSLLGFKNCKFKVYFKDLPELEEAHFTKNGLDEVEFLFSANAGEELKSLSKTISGGEMSRFMLAIKNVFANCFETSTLVFDEVDTGISGEIGQMVAQRLAVLSKNYQLICINHLCQVTAMADNYIFVKKQVQEGKTFTSIEYLGGEDIIKYIAVVSGAKPTDVAIQFARELKQKAEDFKAKI
ncbi:MAG: DNA repair protein RecN, partial [Clostridia bacterium]|nr:DNA repair protein RecN [Clostridia bacterium]